MSNNDVKNPFLLKLIGFGSSYFIKTPWWLKKFYPKREWDVDTKEKILYLTFDDGPDPTITPFVLEELKKYKARATFFCIGEQVSKHPDIYQRILNEGHSAGNHTQQHFNGWKTRNDIYLSDIAEAAKTIKTNLFRPPFGRLRSSQARKLAGVMGVNNPRVIMWDVLSGDFDEDCPAARSIGHITRHSKPGSIVVFHDSERVMPKLKIILPEVLRYFKGKGYSFKAL